MRAEMRKSIGQLEDETEEKLSQENFLEGRVKR